MKTLLTMLLAPLAAVAIGCAPESRIETVAPPIDALSMARLQGGFVPVAADGVPSTTMIASTAEQRTRNEEGAMVMTPRTTTGFIEIQ